MVAQEVEPPGRLPRGPHRLGREVVRASQHGRLLDAMTAEVAERGYAATSVAHVLRTAGVSRSTFYELFPDKASCFLGALDLGITRIAHEIEAEVADTNRAERLLAGFRALCRGLADDPAFARASLLRAPEAGDVTHEHQQVIREGASVMIRDMVRAGRNRCPDLPAEISESAARAVVGAVESLLAHHVETRGAESLPALVDTLVAVTDVLLRAEVPDPLTGVRPTG